MSKAFRVFLLCSALAVPFLGSSTAHAATFVSNTGACLTVKDENTADRTRIQAIQCFGRFGQQWRWEGLRILGIGTADFVFKCVEVEGGGTADGTPVQLFQCNGGSGQQWFFNNGLIVNVRSGKCLDVGNGSSQTSARIRTCNGISAGQFWSIRN